MLATISWIFAKFFMFLRKTAERPNVGQNVMVAHIMLLNKMCIRKGFICRLCIKQYLGFCFLYNTAEIAQGTVTFVFSCFLVCFVLLCSVLRLVNDNKYPVQNRKKKSLIITQMKYQKVEKRSMK